MKIFIKTLKTSVMILGGVLLTTVLIDASDNINNFSGSLLGSIIGVSQEERGLCPEGMSFISSSKGSFCIDTYTASASEHCPHPKPSSQAETRENILASGCVPVSESGFMPWRYISQIQAQEICRKAGKFLPSNEYWFYASQGSPSVNNKGEEPCNLNNNWQDNPGKTGTSKDCVSFSGAYDMVGNVWEWVNETVYDGFIENQKLPDSGYVTSINTNGVVLETDPVHPNENYDNDYFWINPEGTRGVMRGGFFGSGTDGGVYSFHAEMAPDFSGRAVGFRCAMETLR